MGLDAVERSHRRAFGHRPLETLASRRYLVHRPVRGNRNAHQRLFVADVGAGRAYDAEGGAAVAHADSDVEFARRSNGRIGDRGIGTRGDEPVERPSRRLPIDLGKPGMGVARHGSDLLCETNGPTHGDGAERLADRGQWHRSDQWTLIMTIKTGLTVAHERSALEKLAINTIRTLCMDAVQAA